MNKLVGIVVYGMSYDKYHETHLIDPLLCHNCKVYVDHSCQEWMKVKKISQRKGGRSVVEIKKCAVCLQEMEPQTSRLLGMRLRE